jgi:hypothetical protein
MRTRVFRMHRGDGDRLPSCLDLAGYLPRKGGCTHALRGPDNWMLWFMAADTMGTECILALAGRRRTLLSSGRTIKTRL